MKKIIVIVVFISSDTLHGQSLSLAECLSSARQNHPMIQAMTTAGQIGDKTRELSEYTVYPRVSLNAQASYQSDVTRVDVPIPNVEIPYPTNDQYRATLDVIQPIYNGGILDAFRQQTAAATAVQKQQSEVQLNELERQVSELYGAILVAAQNDSILHEAIRTLGRRLNIFKKAVEHGAAKPGDADLFEAELLTVQQKQQQLAAEYKQYVSALGTLCGLDIDPGTKFCIPVSESPEAIAALTRPELVQFDLQIKKLDADKLMNRTKARPRLSAFVQGGYGQPGLNMLDDSFQPFYIAGLRLNWQLSAFYTRHGESEIIGLQQQLIGEQKEAFELAVNTRREQLMGSIDAMKAAFEQDKQIIRLRQRVADEARKSMEAGAGTISDYLMRQRDLRDALMQRNLHNIQLRMNITRYYLISGASLVNQ